MLIAGDFNLAPREEDGWYGNTYSDFTKESERKNFLKFLRKYELYDLGTMILQDVYTRKPYNEGVFWVHHTSMLIGYALAMVRWLSWGRGKRGLGTHGEDRMNDLVQA